MSKVPLMSSLVRGTTALRGHAWMSVVVIVLAAAVASVATALNLVCVVTRPPLLVPAPNEMVVIGSELRRGVVRGSTPSVDLLSYADFQSLRVENDVFRAVAGISSFDVPLLARRVGAIEGESRREILSARLVGGDYFALFGVKPALGRLLDPTDDVIGGQANVVVISHSYWRDRFRARSNVVGTEIVTARATLTIVGVAAPSFTGETVGRPPDLWAPLSLQPAADADGGLLDDAGAAWIIGMARLKRGVNPEQAQPRVNVVLRRILARRLDGANASRVQRSQVTSMVVALRPGGRGLFDAVRPITRPVIAAAAIVTCLFFAVSAVITLWCATHVRSERRPPAGASTPGDPIRSARLMWPWLVVCLAVCALASVTTPRLVEKSMALLISVASLRLPVDADIRVRVTVLTLAVVATFGIGVAATSTRRQAAVRGVTSRGSDWARSVIVAFHSAMTIALIYWAWVLAADVRDRQNADVGIARRDTLLAQVEMPAGPPGSGLARSRTLIRDVRGVPGVEDAALASSLVLTTRRTRQSVSVFGAGGSRAENPTVVTVTGEFFRTIQNPVLLGRPIDDSDVTIRPQVAVVNQAFVAAYFGNRPVLGTSMRVGAEQVTVIGVVGNVLHAPAGSPPPAVVYLPVPAGSETVPPALYIRVSGAPDVVSPLIADALSRPEGSDAWVRWIRTLDEHVHDSVAGEQLLARLLAAFAAVAVVIMAAGVVAVSSLVRPDAAGTVSLAAAAGRRPADLERRRASGPFVVSTVIGTTAASALLILSAGRVFRPDAPWLPVVEWAESWPLVLGVASFAVAAATFAWWRTRHAPQRREPVQARTASR